MGSQIGWLASSRDEQQKMREMLNLFSENDTRDELGIGQIRDAFSDALFPGTSTLLGRARYFVLIPWCFQKAESKEISGRRLEAAVERNEKHVLFAIRDMDDTKGLVGKRAGKDVKTLPSTIYWSALLRYGIRIEANQYRDGSAANGAFGDLEETEVVVRRTTNWHRSIPAPPPEFPREVPGGFAMTRDEAEWLRERMLETAPGTWLAHFLQTSHRPSEDSPAPWTEASTNDAALGLRVLLEQAELFSLVMHGAALLYNLLIAERYAEAGFSRVAGTDQHYRDLLAVWADDVAAERRLATWDMRAMWAQVESVNPRIRANASTKSFVTSWVKQAIACGGKEVADSKVLRELVASRERNIKKGQSRLLNKKLLQEWSGQSGSSALTFRWQQVRQILTDIHNGLEA